MPKNKEFKIKFPNYFPAVDLMRGEFVDQRFFAIVSLFKMQNISQVNKCTADGKGLSNLKFCINNLQENVLFGRHNNCSFFLRSLLKPIQASIMADYNTQNHYGFFF